MSATLLSLTRVAGSPRKFIASSQSFAILIVSQSSLIALGLLRAVITVPSLRATARQPFLVGASAREFVLTCSLDLGDGDYPESKIDNIRWLHNDRDITDMLAAHAWRREQGLNGDR